MKNLGIWIFILVLAGCSKQKFKDLEADPEVLNEKQLRESREQVRTFIPNADSSKLSATLRYLRRGFSSTE